MWPTVSSKWLKVKEITWNWSNSRRLYREVKTARRDPSGSRKRNWITGQRGHWNITTERIGWWIEQIFYSSNDLIESKTRSRKFGEVRIQYKEGGIAESMAEEILQSDNWMLYPTYMNIKVVRVRVARMGCDKELISASLLNKLEE